MWVPGYVEVVTAFDAERCPDPVPGGYQVALVYAGGSSCAHVWDNDELARVEHLPRLPIWVPTPGSDDPELAARDFLAALDAMGCHPDPADVSHDQAVMWDMETGKEPDPVWLDKAADVLQLAGYLNLPYGSTSTLFGQPRRDGYMVATDSKRSVMYPRADVQGTQWDFDVDTRGGQIDRWLLRAELLPHLWHPAR